MFWSSAGQRGCVGLLRRCRSAVGARTPMNFGRPPRSPRFFSLSAPSKCVAAEEGEAGQPPRQWALEVSPFCTVRAQLGCSVSVRPLDPHAFPEADRAFVAVRGPGTEPPGVVDRVHVRYDGQKRELLISAEEVSSSSSIDLVAPIKSDLFISTRGKASVQVKKMECDICKVQTEEGDCSLHSVKGHQVEVTSNGGHVTGLGTIHGNVDISTRGEGAVDVKKLQGTKMNVSTEHGPLKVKAIYAESSCFSSCSGRVELGHVHGNATVKNVSGDVVVDGSNSFLDVSSRSGDIDVYVGQGGSAKLHTQEGAVCVRVPSSVTARVELRGLSVEISPEVVMHGVENNTAESQVIVSGCINGESPVDQRVTARADRGPVTLRTQSWFESLKLGS